MIVNPQYYIKIMYVTPLDFPGYPKGQLSEIWYTTIKPIYSEFNSPKHTIEKDRIRLDALLNCPDNSKVLFSIATEEDIKFFTDPRLDPEFSASSIAVLELDDGNN
jgi:hypothetical protein